MVKLAALFVLVGSLASQPSDRVVELLRFDCRSDIGRREVTLFANGTVRLRDGLEEREEIRLAELAGEEVQAYVRRIEEEDLSETQDRYFGVEGAWVERCELHLALPGGERRRFAFGRFDSLSLQLRRLVAIAHDLIDEVDPRQPPLRAGPGLPRDYAPEPGDLLRRADGQLFEVVGLTADKRGVELLGLDQPLTLYILKEELPQSFVALESRAVPWPEP